MRKKVAGTLIIAACLAMIVWGLFSVLTLAAVRHWGQKVTAVVAEIPSTCDRYNHIRLRLNGELHEISISRDDCRDKLYKVGQGVEVLKLKNCDVLVWPESQYSLLVLLILAPLAYSLLQVKKQLRKKRNV